MRPAFDELVTAPDVYGLFAYVFLKPTPTVQHYVDSARRRLPAFDVGVHVRRRVA